MTHLSSPRRLHPPNPLRQRMRLIHTLRGSLDRLHRNLHEDRARVLTECLQRYRHLLPLSQRLDRGRFRPGVPWSKTLEPLAREMRDLRHGLDRVLESHGPTVPVRPQRFGTSSLPSCRCLYDELEQLENDFGGLRIDRRGREVSVTTESITLEGWDLGPFVIRLWLDALPEACRSAAYAVEAVRPCPAAGSPEITHPHVSGGRLCEGESAMAIRRALIDGRLADFFLMVRGVLRTYNPDSPFVALDDWDDLTCHDCGGRCGEACVCDVCDHAFCEDCSFFCEQQQTSVCFGCGQEAGPEAAWCHPDAVASCLDCDGRFTTDDLDADGRCDDCAIEADAEDGDDESPAPSDSASGLPGCDRAAVVPAASPTP